MKRNLVFLMTLFVSVCSYGQGEIDALQYSRNDLTGTARGMGMAGAFGALGGDVTGIAVNPAGVGVYRSSELVATMNFSSVNVKTNFLGTIKNDNKFKFNFDNLSYVGYFPLGNESMQNINFGFSYNRLKNFDRTYSSSSTGIESSLTDYMANITNQWGPAPDELDVEQSDPYYSEYPWLSVLGYNGFLMTPNPESGASNDVIYGGLYPNESKSQRLAVSEKGRVESFDFTLGSNFGDHFYFGGTFSITDIFYSMSSLYAEDFELGGGYDLNNYLETNGGGYGFTVGAIYRPVDALRLGVSYHSPTWYAMTDYFYGNTVAELDDLTHQSWTPEDNPYYDYRFQSPYSWVFSIASVIGTKAVVSFDYEIKDYTTMNLQDSYGLNLKDNEYIDTDFRIASTAKIGIEYKALPQLALRAGYAWVQNPYTTDFRNGNIEVRTAGTVPHYTIEGDVNYATFGLGYRLNSHFYLDAAFVYKTQTDQLYNYSPIFNEDYVESTPAKFSNNTYKGIFTLGYKF